MAKVSCTRNPSVSSPRSYDSTVAPTSRSLDAEQHSGLLTAFSSHSLDAGAIESSCRVCGVALGKRRLNPRHHCRICGQCVCGACSPSTLKLDGQKGLQRVCTPCAGNVQNATLMISRLGVLTTNLHLLARSSRRPVLYTFGDRCVDEAERQEEEALVTPDSLEQAVAGVEATVERLRRAFEADATAYREAENTLASQQEVLRQFDARVSASTEQLAQLGWHLHELCDDSGAASPKRLAFAEQSADGKHTLEESIGFCRGALGSLKELRQRCAESQERVNVAEAAAKLEREQRGQIEQSARDRIWESTNALRNSFGAEAVCQKPDLEECLKSLEEALAIAKRSRGEATLDVSSNVGSGVQAADAVIGAIQRLSKRMRDASTGSSVPEVRTLGDAITVLDALPTFVSHGSTDHSLLQMPIGKPCGSRCPQQLPQVDDEVLLYNSPSSSTRASTNNPLLADEVHAIDSPASTVQSDLQASHKQSSCCGGSTLPRNAHALSRSPSDSGPRHKACGRQCSIM